MAGHQVPQQIVVEVGETFKKILNEVGFLQVLHGFFIYTYILSSYNFSCARILKLIFFFSLLKTEKVRNEHNDDMSIHRAISIVLDRHPDLR